ALRIFREIGTRGNENWALNHYGALLVAAGDLTRARACYADAMTLADETDQPEERALALEGTALCDLAEGADAAAAERLAEALKIFQRLAMTPDATRIHTRLTQG